MFYCWKICLRRHNLKIYKRHISPCFLLVNKFKIVSVAPLRWVKISEDVWVDRASQTIADFQIKTFWFSSGIVFSPYVALIG